MSADNRQPMSVYFVMLLVSAILMLFACILMSIEMVQWGSPWEDPSAGGANNIPVQTQRFLV